MFVIFHKRTLFTFSTLSVFYSYFLLNCNMDFQCWECSKNNLRGGLLYRNKTYIREKGASFQRKCGAASVGVLQDNLVLSTGLIM